MVVRKLPAAVVKRLQKLVEREQQKDPSLRRAHRLMGQLAHADHRAGTFYGKGADTLHPGQRVRELDVHRNYPGLRVVLKRMHQETKADPNMPFLPFGRESDATTDAVPKIELKRIKNRIRWLNAERFLRRVFGKNPGFVVRAPVAYPLGGSLIAMSYANFPTIIEMIAGKVRNVAYSGQTKRGREYLSFLEGAFGVTEKQLVGAAYRFDRMAANAGIEKPLDNFVCAGVEKGKFVFVSLADSY